MPLRAVDLLSSTNSETDTRVTEKRSRRTRVDAGIEVEVGAVLVSSREAVLSAQRVARSRAEVVDLDNDAVAGVGQSVAARVRLGGQFPAGTAGWAGSAAWADTELVLRDGCAVAGLAGGVETAGGAGGLAVGRAKAVTGSILGEGGLVGACCDGRGLCWGGGLGRGGGFGGDLGGGGGDWKALGVVDTIGDAMATCGASGRASVALTTALAIDGDSASCVGRAAEGSKDEELGKHFEGETSLPET